MAKIKTSYVPGSAFKKYASSFWLDRDFDTSFKSGGSVDYTKLAAAQRAIGNFVNIVTGQQIPVVFQNNDASYTDGNSVTYDMISIDNRVGSTIISSITNLLGQEVNENYRGIVVVTYTDGSVEKIMK